MQDLEAPVLGVRRCMRKHGDGCFQKQNLSLWKSGDFKIFHLECVSERVHPGSNLELERVIWEPVCKPNDLACLVYIGRGQMGGIVNSRVSCDLANLREEVNE